MKNRLFSILLVIAAVAVLALALPACGKKSEKAKTESQIKQDVCRSDGFFSENPDCDPKIKIKKRQTNPEQKTDFVWVEFKAENYKYYYEAEYKLSYTLYNEGWMLDDVQMLDRNFEKKSSVFPDEIIASEELDAYDQDVVVISVSSEASEKADLILELPDGSRTEFEVEWLSPKSIRVPVGALLPNEPIEGAFYYGAPKLFLICDDGSEAPVRLDPVQLPVNELGLTFDSDYSDLSSIDGKVDIKGHILYPDAELTMNGEKVEIGPDGMFSKEFLFEQPGSYTINVEAKLPNFSIARRTFTVTVGQSAPSDAFIQMPWDYGDTSFSQRVKSTVENIEVRGKVPEGSSVTAFCASSNATVSTPTVDAEGNFKFTVNMKNQGDYTIKVTCTTARGNTLEKEIHVQRQPDYAQFKNEAKPADYAGFSRADGTKYKIAGEITEMIKEGDYYLAKFQLTEGNTIIIEYHPHFGSGRELKPGDTFNEMYGRSWGPIAQGEENAGTIRFYVWFIDG